MSILFLLLLFIGIYSTITILPKISIEYWKCIAKKAFKVVIALLILFVLIFTIVVLF